MMLLIINHRRRTISPGLTPPTVMSRQRKVSNCLAMAKDFMQLRSCNYRSGRVIVRRPFLTVSTPKSRQPFTCPMPQWRLQSSFLPQFNPPRASQACSTLTLRHSHSCNPRIPRWPSQTTKPAPSSNSIFKPHPGTASMSTSLL